MSNQQKDPTADPVIKSLADFKRFLGQQGATVQIIRSDWAKGSEKYLEPKTVKTLQSNGVFFSSGSWLQFEKASHYKFNDDEVTISLSVVPDRNPATGEVYPDAGKPTFKEVMVYKCWIVHTCGCRQEAQHYYHGEKGPEYWCCGGSMCCPNRNI